MLEMERSQRGEGGEGEGGPYPFVHNQATEDAHRGGCGLCIGRCLVGGELDQLGKFLYCGNCL